MRSRRDTGGPVTDVHIHIQPQAMLKPAVRAVFEKGARGKHADASAFEDPQDLLAHLDTQDVARAVLINYESPDVLGFPTETNDWVIEYCKAAPDRLLPCVGINPRFEKDVAGEAKRLVDGGARMFKIHGPHMLVRPNAYLDEQPTLADLYRVATESKVPVMFHTGTSIFPGARIRFGDPMLTDDVGCDFPDLDVILAHGGRPLWMETAWFLLRRFPRFHLDISGIPPKRLPEWFPRLLEIQDRVLFGTDWPSPGVPSVGENLAAVRALPFSREMLEKMVSENALRLFPA